MTDVVWLELSYYQHTIHIYMYLIHAVQYRIAGNFCGVQFSRMASFQSFRVLIFADAYDHAH
jgi:hypothetical protein